jgi:hypothetical protein
LHNIKSQIFCFILGVDMGQKKFAGTSGVI